MADAKVTAKQAYQSMKSGIPEVVAAYEKLLKAGSVLPATTGDVAKDAKFADWVAKWKLPTIEKAARVGSFGGAGVSGFFKITFGEQSQEYQSAMKVVATVKSLNEALKAKGKKEFIAPPFMRGTGTPRTAKAA